MHEAMLYEKLPGSRVRCGTCQWRCNISPSRYGFCGMYRNVDGVLRNISYAQVSSLAVDPIEKKPLFHFYPATQVFSVGGWSCNFKCRGCQNWQISATRDKEMWHGNREIMPRELVSLAERYECDGIAWTYNEPSVWFEYTVDSARLAKEKGLYTVYVTNGYLTPEALDIIGPYLDAWRVDVKGFTDSVYRQMCGISHWRGILDVAERAKTKWGMHVEVVTNIVPALNDDDEQLKDIAKWICNSLGQLTPWHVTRFHPQYELTGIPATPVSTLEHALDIGLKAGLKFVYLGNVPGHDSENTACYSCGKQVVARAGYETTVISLDGSRCGYCGAELGFREAGAGGEHG